MDIIFSDGDISKTASSFIRAMGDSKVFLFEGAMGAGKTTLIREICKQLGVIENVSSPTFSIINEYRATERQNIFHLDLYRIHDEAEARRAGVEEPLYSGELCFVEWPSNAKDLLPADAVMVNIDVMDDSRRKLSMRSPQELGDNR